MPLKFSFTELFKGRFPNPKKLFECLNDLSDRIDEKAISQPVHVYDIKLNKTNLKKAFGNPKEFNYIGIVHNTEGSYIVVADKYGHWLINNLSEV